MHLSYCRQALVSLTLWLSGLLWEGTYGDSTPKLKMVHVLFRHGDRSPIQKYTNDIYEESDWPQGYGQLSLTGMRQEYKLGEFFHDRYVATGFLSSTYKRLELSVRSTDVDRTLMSAASMLTALYPPRTDIPPIEPIPIHTTTRDTDTVLVTDVFCPDSVQDTAAIDKLKEETLKKYKDVYENIAKNSGEPNTFEGIKNVLDPIFCQKMSNYTLSNYTLPNWVTDKLFEQIVELRDVYATAMVQCRPSLVKLIVENMTNKTKTDNSIPQKMFVFSAHDSTVASLLQTLQVFNHRQPPYTACVIIELYEHPAGHFSVQVSYRNESDVEPFIFTVPGCSEMCPLDKLTDLLQPVLKESGVQHTNDTNDMQAIIVVIVLSCALALTWILVAVMCYKYRRYSIQHQDYSPVPIEMT